MYVHSDWMATMKFQQYYLDCLSHASYLIGDTTTGRAVVVDPRRDVHEYLADAQANGLRIELVIETHFHADFLSGHLELAAATGARIAYGKAAETDYPIRTLVDRERISLGEVTLEILETPGHTPESICVVVYEHPDDDVPYGVLTGDTLFIGDVGRPDLLGSLGFTAEQMARKLYHSLRAELMPLPDATRVFPAHGAGSACGRNLATETTSTIGQQKLVNHALRPMSEDDFVAVVTADQPTAPGYFGFDAILNRRRHPLLDEDAVPPVIGINDALAAASGGAVLLDTRPAAEFAAAHLRGSLQVGLDTRFAEYAGSIIPPNTPIVLIGDAYAAAEAKVRLARIGFDTVRGHLPDVLAALAARPELAARTSRLDVATLHQRRADLPALRLIDVRNPGEHAAGAIPGATLLPLATLREHLDELNPAAPVVLYCRGGTRSIIATALLESHGFTDVSDLLGGYEAAEHASGQTSETTQVRS
jgi:glyoxylase-like metal-dependent hydrolase (beta-lactamase superfamily II)/rhodanese-related sulfurtransferase